METENVETFATSLETEISKNVGCNSFCNKLSFRSPQ